MSLRIDLSCIGVGTLLRGGELIVEQLASHLALAGHDVTLYQAGPARADAPYAARVLPLPYRFYDLVAPPLQPTLASVAGRLRRYGALSCITAFCAAAQAAALRRRPDVFVVQHGWPEAHLQVALQRLGVRTVALGNGPLRSDALLVASSLDAFVATNPVQAEWARYFHGAPVTLLKMGVDLQRFHPQGEAEPRVLALPGPRVILCGALIAIKRVELAIDALVALGRGSLILVGEGPLRAVLAARLAQVLPGRHLLAGAVPHQALGRWYRAAEVLAFPSAPAETAGQVVLEAMACGTPVVASADPIRRWLVGAGGLTTEVEEPRRFAAAIDAVVQGGTTQRAAAQRAAARVQAERSGWPQVAASFAALCADLQRGRPVRPEYQRDGEEPPPRSRSGEGLRPAPSRRAPA